MTNKTSAVGFLSSISEELLIPMYIDNTTSGFTEVILVIMNNEHKKTKSQIGKIVQSPYYTLPIPGKLTIKNGKLASPFYNIQVDSKRNLVSSLEKWIMRHAAFARLYKKHDLFLQIVDNGEKLIKDLISSTDSIESYKDFYPYLLKVIYSKIIKNVDFKLISIDMSFGKIIGFESNDIFTDKISFITLILSKVSSSIQMEQIVYLSKYNQNNFQIKLQGIWQGVNKIHRKNDEQTIFYTRDNEISLVFDMTRNKFIIENVIEDLDIVLKKEFTNFIVSLFGYICHIPWYTFQPNQELFKSNKKGHFHLSGVEFIKPFWPKAYRDLYTLQHPKGSLLIDYSTDRLNDYMSIYIGDISLFERRMLQNLLTNISGRSESYNNRLKKTNNLYNFLLKNYSSEYNNDKFIFNLERNNIIQLLELSILFRSMRKSIYCYNYEELARYIDLLKKQNFYDPAIGFNNNFYEYFIDLFVSVKEKTPLLYEQCEKEIEILKCNLNELSAKDFRIDPELINANSLYTIEKLFGRVIRIILVFISDLFDTCLHANIWLLYLIIGSDHLSSVVESIVEERKTVFNYKPLLIRN